MKCPDCEHDAKEHFFRCNSEDCDCGLSNFEVLLALLTEAKPFIERIVNEWEHEEEYAGRMEDYCTYCGTWQEPRKPKSHDKDCLHLKAVDFLKKLEEQ